MPRSLTEVNGFAAAPALAADGRAVVVVSDYSAQRSRVLAYARSARGRWAAPVTLRTSKQELLEPRAAYTGDGTAVFTWLRAPRIDQEQIVETRRLPAGGTFGPITAVSPAGSRAVLARVAGGPGGRALIGWEDGDYALRVGAEQVFDRRQFGFALGFLPDGTEVAMSQAFGAALIALSAAPVAGASEARFSTPRSLTEVNGFAAAPAIAADGRAVARPAGHAREHRPRARG